MPSPLLRRFCVINSVGWKIAWEGLGITPIYLGRHSVFQTPDHQRQAYFGSFPLDHSFQRNGFAIPFPLLRTLELLTGWLLFWHEYANKRVVSELCIAVMEPRASNGLTQDPQAQITKACCASANFRNRQASYMDGNPATPRSVAWRAFGSCVSGPWWLQPSSQEFPSFSLRWKHHSSFGILHIVLDCFWALTCTRLWSKILQYLWLQEGNASGPIHVRLSIVISSVQSCNKTLLHLLLLVIFTFCCPSFVAANCDGAMSASATSWTGPPSRIGCSAIPRRSHNLLLSWKGTCTITGYCL